MKYNPNEEFATFATDAGELGIQNVLSHLPSNLGMRDLVSFRNFLRLMVQQNWISEASLAEKPVSGDSQPQMSLNAQDQVLNLSKIPAAIVAGDQPKLASLAEELEPCDELRKLVKNLGAGQPVREMEPSEGALREAKLALKMGCVVHFHSPKVEDILKTKRPLPHSVCSERHRLWAAVLQQRCSMGDVLNWIAQVCLVASDKAIADPNMAEKVASVYGFRLLHEAYQVSRQGDTESCGLRNVSDVLSSIDWAGVRRVWDEIQTFPSSGTAVVRKDSSSDRSFYCLKALFDKCTSSCCKHLRGCPFFSSRLYACKFMSAPFVKQGWDLLPSQADGRGARDSQSQLAVLKSEGRPRSRSKAAPVPAATGLPMVLPSSSAFYNGFEKLGNDSLAFKLGGSHLPGYGIVLHLP